MLKRQYTYINIFKYNKHTMKIEQIFSKRILWDEMEIINCKRSLAMNT